MRSSFLLSIWQGKGSQSRHWQSAKLFSSRRGIGTPPNPSPAGECAPPLVPGGSGGHSLAREGAGESQFLRPSVQSPISEKVGASNKYKTLS